MAVYEGVLEKMSGGREVAPGGTSETITDSGRVVRHGVDRRIRREFIEIGGQHVKNVVLTPYHDQLLVDSMGEQVALSAFGRGAKQVVAIRTRRGLDRPHFLRLVAQMIWAVILSWLLALILGGLLLGMGALTTVDLIGWLGLAVAGFLVLYPFVRYVRIFRAWGALTSRMPIHPSPIP